MINDVIRLSGPVDVLVVSTDAPASARRGRHRPGRAHALSARRRTIAWALAVAIPLALTVVLLGFGTTLGLASDLLVYLSGSVVVATVGGLAPALVCALASSLLANWFFTEPQHTLTISEPENLLAIVVFVLVAGVVGVLVSRAARKSAEAARAGSQAETLAALAALSNDVDDPLVPMLGQVRQALGGTGASFLRRTADGAWTVDASEGSDAPVSPDSAALWAPIDDDAAIALNGDGLAGSDLTVLTAFCAQMSTVMHQQQLRREASAAQQLAEVNDLRAALLAAVSHDLRTPLAAIKASASSLRQTDVHWPDDVRDEFLETIERQTDRLTDLVSNLLGMSRIQAGAIQLKRRPAGVDEIVTAALGDIDALGVTVEVEIDPELPPLDVDPDLAERVVANLIDNAVKWSPAERAVRITAAASGDHVTLVVIDHGPGIPIQRRDQVFEPFQRLGDGTVGGTGLGLAVALGLTQVLGGTLEIDDTPRGGTTMILRLPALAEGPRLVEAIVR